MVFELAKKKTTKIIGLKKFIPNIVYTFAQFWTVYSIQ